MLMLERSVRFRYNEVVMCIIYGVFFFFQAEDGIRDLVRSRGLGDVYKRQVATQKIILFRFVIFRYFNLFTISCSLLCAILMPLSLIHI